MRFFEGGVLAVVVALLSPQLAAAACTSGRCRDENVVAAARSRVAAACNCSLMPTHKQYVRCAKQVIKAAMKDGSLPGSCKKAVHRCEAETTCGQTGAMVCCVMNGKGRAKARVVKSADKCSGTACPGVSGAADACTPQGTCAGLAATFRTVQKVFTESCALPSCHSPLARKGELVLDSEEVSYTNLVGEPAIQPEARAAGLMRVKSGDPGDSFLVRKLRGLGPGDPMPQGTPPLPGSIIAMIENWIARGAHTTAEDCPAAASATAGTQQSVCDGPPLPPGDYVWKPEPPLDVPTPGEGLQLYVPRRDVAPGTEWEVCYAFRPNWPQIAAGAGLPAGTLPYVRRQEYRMHAGSHHLLLYAYFGQHPEVWPEGFFPCFAANCTNPGDCPEDAGQFTLPIGGTQVAGTRYVVDYPQGVGLPILGPTNVLIADLHFTNPFQPPQPIYGEAWLNLYFYKPGEFKVLLDGIFAINYRDMFVEPYATRTISHIWQPRSILTRAPVDAAVFQLFGHMHKRGELFQIDYVKGGRCSASGALCGRDDDCTCKPYDSGCQQGQTCVRGADAEDVTIYHTTEWDRAPVVDFAKPYLLVDIDQGLRWTCTHTNGYRDDPNRPPKRCTEGCNSCGWDPGTRTCVFTRGVDLGYDAQVRVFQEGDPMPLVFGELADDDMCNMFGYFVAQSSLPLIP